MLSEACRLGYERGMVDAGLHDGYISANRARKRFGAQMVRRWVREGLLVGHKNGGNTSTVNYSVQRLLELEASERLIVPADIKSFNKIHRKIK
jgi:hypothetical protein